MKPTITKLHNILKEIILAISTQKNKWDRNLLLNKIRQLAGGEWGY